MSFLVQRILLQDIFQGWRRLGLVFSMTCMAVEAEAATMQVVVAVAVARF
jgi:hypothetical protein